MSYVLIKYKDSTNKHDFTDVKIKFDAVTLDEMLEAYEDFLKACGFAVKSGSLEIKDTDEAD
jgi:hypothetical protein